jgi:hypothetical protein
MALLKAVSVKGGNMKGRFFHKRCLVRRAIAAMALLLLGAICTLTGQQFLGLTMSSVMTKDELNETGVASLSLAQRTALDAWLNRYTMRVMHIVTKATAEKPARSGSGCTPTIETSISGEFNGWEGETIFKLSNGQIWQQAEYDYMYSYSYMPDVTIYATQSGCRMKVEDENETVLVKRIK